MFVGAGKAIIVGSCPFVHICMDDGGCLPQHVLFCCVTCACFLGLTSFKRPDLIAHNVDSRRCPAGEIDPITALSAITPYFSVWCATQRTTVEYVQLRDRAHCSGAYGSVLQSCKRRATLLAWPRPLPELACLVVAVQPLTAAW